MPFPDHGGDEVERRRMLKSALIAASVGKKSVRSQVSHIDMISIANRGERQSAALGIQPPAQCAD
jgi:hypothetical protein